MLPTFCVKHLKMDKKASTTKKQLKLILKTESCSNTKSFTTKMRTVRASRTLLTTDQKVSCLNNFESSSHKILKLNLRRISKKHSRHIINPVFTRVTINVSHILLLDHKLFVIYLGYYSHLFTETIKLQKQLLSIN